MFNSFFKSRGFTLIELLVVISIISLLASVVIASLNTAREKGRLGAIKYFASQVDHVAGEQAAGVWDFDECTGSTTVDRSGFGNIGILNGTPLPTWSSDTPSGTGCSLSFNGTNQYITMNTNGFPAVNDPYTIAAWIKPNAMGAYGIFGYGNYGTLDQVNALRLNASSPNGIWNYWWNHDLGANVTLADGKWHQVVATFDGTTRAVYADGVRLSTDTPAGHNAILMNATIARTWTSEYFPGLIDGVRIFSKGLTASEVGKLYAEDGKKYHYAKN